MLKPGVVLSAIIFLWATFTISGWMVAGASVAAQTSAFTSTCFNRMSVSTTTIVGRYVDPMNTSALEDSGLVADCVTLLAIRDTLGATSLNWRADLPIDQWQGVTVSNSRVIELNLNRSGLMGEIPAELGNLSHLRELDLAHNQLTGEIPTELGNLSNLQVLLLASNQLTGPIPAELGSLSNLQVLLLASNQLTGEIPTELGNLSHLWILYLEYNQLTGTIPAELGSLSNLQVLLLGSNQLTGPIPAELGNLANSLQILFLGDNQLTGCIPNALSRVSDNDLLSLGLSFCDLPPDAYLPRAPTVVARPR